MGFEILFFETGPVGRPGVRAPGKDGGRASIGCNSASESSATGSSLEMPSVSMHASSACLSSFIEE